MSPDQLHHALAEGPITADLLLAVNETARRLYWEEKNAPAALRLLQAAAERTAGDDAEHGLPLKRVLYNLASYGWRGWDEPGMVIPSEIAPAACEASRRHLEIAESLQLDPLPRARAHWLRGALLLQESNPSAAARHFRQSAELAATAGNQAESLNASAFEALSQLLNGDSTAEARLGALLLELRNAPDGAELADQAPTALRVFRMAP